MSCFCTVGPGFNWEVLVLQDYPSIAHLVQKLSDHNIQTIFAVTEEFQPVYKVNVNALTHACRSPSRFLPPAFVSVSGAEKSHS